MKVKTNSRRVRFTFQNVGLDEIKSFDLDDSRNGIFWEIAKTASYTAKGASFRKLPPELLLEAEHLFRNKRIINPFGAFRKYVQKKSKPSEPLVNQSTKQIEKTPHDSDNSLFDNVLRGKNEPLKTYGTRLCEQGLRDTWLRYLEVNADLIIAKRRDALLERFPNSVFTDLSGRSYYGWRAVKELKQREKEKQPGYDPESDNYYRFKVYQAQYLDAVAVDVCKPASVTPTPHNASPRSYKTGRPAQVERMASWELFDSFYGLGSENQQARIV